MRAIFDPIGSAVVEEGLLVFLGVARDLVLRARLPFMVGRLALEARTLRALGAREILVHRGVVGEGIATAWGRAPDGVLLCGDEGVYRVLIEAVHYLFGDIFDQIF